MRSSSQNKQSLAGHRGQSAAGSSSAIFVVAAILLVAVVGFLVFRSQAPQQAPEAQTSGSAKADQTKTVAGAGRDLTRHTGAPEEGTIKKWSAVLFDPAQALKARRQAAFELAKIGSDEAMTELKLALKDANATLRAYAAEAIGTSSHPEARALLKELIHDKDDMVAMGAARGYKSRGDREAIDVLAGVMSNAQRSETLRSEAAEALGSIKDPSALAVLIQAAKDSKEADLLGSIFKGIGQRPFSETKDFYQQYLAKTDVSSEIRVAAIESIGTAEGQTMPFLLQYAKDPDPDVRAGATWAMSTSPQPGTAGAELLNMLNAESDNNVRMRLYQALGNQEQVDMNAVMGMVQREVNSSTRLAGWGVLAAAIADPTANPAVTQFFNQSAVPELQKTALSGATDYERMTAAITLRQARTPEAMQALRELATQAKDPRIAKIAQTANRPQPGTQSQTPSQK